MKNSSKAKEAKRARERLATENLADSYIRKLMRASMLRLGIEMVSADIPPEVIRAKREIVRLRRACRELIKS
jgi:hypothetical protein